MKFRRCSLFAVLLLITITLAGQQTKKPLDHEDIQKWNRITGTELNTDGSFVAYHLTPWVGDAVLKVRDMKGKEVLSVQAAAASGFSQDGRYLVYTQKTPYEKEMELRRAKTKKDDMPKDDLVVYDLKKGEAKTIEAIRSHKMPSKWSGFLAYQAEAPKTEKKEEAEEGEKKKEKKESARNGYHLHLMNLKTGEEQLFPFVKEYYFAEEAEVLVFLSAGNEADFEAGLYRFEIDRKEAVPVYLSEGDFKQIAMTKDANQLAFLLYEGEDKALVKSYDLYLAEGENQAKKVLDKNIEGMPADWIVSEYRRLSFSADGQRLFFGSSPEPPVRDTALLDEEVPEVQVWHYNEPVLHTRQVLEKRRELHRTYTAVYHIDRDEMVQLASLDIPDVRTIKDGDCRYVLATTNLPYGVEGMWEGSPSRLDIYLKDIYSGELTPLKENYRSMRLNSSPGGKYLYWYDPIEESWYTYELASHTERQVTTPSTLAAANELNDVPNYASPYGESGWTPNDEAVILYDRYDIWKVDPKGQRSPVNLTLNGRQTKTVYRLITLNSRRENDFILPEEVQYLSAHNDLSRAEGFYSMDMQGGYPPEQLLWGDYSYSFMADAKEGRTVLITKQDFETFPDLLATDLSFKKQLRLTEANPQQQDFNWGTAEIYSWTSLDGIELEGLLVKPADFDPSKKYPMIVNFYEKSSQGLHSYRTPEPHRSTIDYHYYTSNGYVIFNPDVYYEDGYPGESAYNCVMPGVTSLIEEGFIDKDRIGAQGHSWGGYQVAYLATRTDLFAAIESGAPVVNMFSAYGGIRWWSGLNRSFQYEHTQSRIGLPIWEAPLRYLENSPLFTMDKVTTPILIMHNDEDGHVPWYQGIEYFTALRRLRKPSWMLNYPGEPHWPQQIKNKIDFQIRMSQFFDYFLKGEPMPLWMKEGIPAVKQGVELGYELEK